MEEGDPNLITGHLGIVQSFCRLIIPSLAVGVKGKPAVLRTLDADNQAGE